MSNTAVSNLLTQTNSSPAHQWLWLVSGLVLLGGTAAILRRRREA